MQMCELAELLDYWGENPPAHMILAAVHLGKKKKESAGGREELMAAISKAGGKVRTK